MADTATGENLPPGGEKTKAQLRAENKALKAQRKGAKKGDKAANTGESSKNTSESAKISSENVKKTGESGKSPPKVKPAASDVKLDSVKTEDEKKGEGEEKTKSKAELKRERREKQEAQRKAKELNQQKKTEGKCEDKTEGEGRKEGEKLTKTDSTDRRESLKPAGKLLPGVPKKMQADDPSVVKKLAKRTGGAMPVRTTVQRKVKLFQHLEQYEREVNLAHNIPLVGGLVHPAIISLGLQYAEGVVSGSNARCMAMLAAFKHLIEDYETPADKDLCRDLETKLGHNITFLSHCRPLSVSMGNAVRHLKYHISHVLTGKTEAEAKSHLYDVIDSYIDQKIILAQQAITEIALGKISSGDVILTYGCSSLVCEVLLSAWRSGIEFRVVVADGRPHLNGKRTLRKLISAGVPVSYCLLNAVTYHMPQVTKVLSGAHALLSNGYVTARCGTAQIALIAHSYNIPFLVCCETYKFCERVQVDAYVFNELGDPDELVGTMLGVEPLSSWRDLSSLTLLNLQYDVTPPELVSAVITEQGMLPCTSVPVILRVNYHDA